MSANTHIMATCPPALVHPADELIQKWDIEDAKARGFYDGHKVGHGEGLGLGLLIGIILGCTVSGIPSAWFWFLWMRG
jgi:hypothetical protein